MKNNLSTITLFQYPPKSKEQQQALEDSVFDVASQAHAHLDRARWINLYIPLFQISNLHLFKIFS